MTGKLFISYRRDDTAGHVGRVHDRLALEFGRDLLFMDVDAIPLGMNFIKILHEEVAKCDALLAVIGPNWLEVRDKAGRRRLDDPYDYVRIEIAAALERDIPVIPILLDRAEIPRVDQLPKDIEELALRNGLYVRHASFHGDMDRLIAGLGTLLGRLDPPPASATPRSSAQERAPPSVAGRTVAAEPAKQDQGASARAPWRRPAAIALGGSIVVAAALFGLVIVKRPPVSSLQPPISPMQSLLQSPQQSLATTHRRRQSRRFPPRRSNRRRKQPPNRLKRFNHCRRPHSVPPRRSNRRHKQPPSRLKLFNHCHRPRRVPPRRSNHRRKQPPSRLKLFNHRHRPRSPPVRRLNRRRRSNSSLPQQLHRFRNPPSYRCTGSAKIDAAAVRAAIVKSRASVATAR